MNRRALLATSSSALVLALSSTMVRAENIAVDPPPTLIDASYWGKLEVLSNMLIPSVANYIKLSASRLVTDPEWQRDVVSETRIWSAIYGQLLATDPSESFAPFHLQFLTAIGKLEQAGRLIETAVTEIDAESLKQANELVESSQANITSANALLPDFNFAAGCELA